MKKSKMSVTYLSPTDKKCPVCGSTNIQSITRVTGYLSLDERFGPGKVAERSARIPHATVAKTTK